MKRIGVFVFSIVFILRLQGQGTVIDTLPVVPPHPRLLMTMGDEQRIRAAIGSDNTWKEIHQAILRQCDSLLPLPSSERVMEGIRLDANRWCLYRVFYLSYAWRVTREKKYFEKAEKELLAICSFKDWNPSHYLDVVELTMAAAIGYDWLYNELPASSRAIISGAIINKGILTSYDTSYHAYRKWLSVTNNWNQVCNTGISYGAMAIYDTDPAFAKQVINRSLKSIVISMKDYEPDGAYAEGYSYWGYGSTYNVLFMDGLRKMFGHDFGLSGQSGFMKSAAYMEHMIGPSGQVFNYSDAGARATLQPAMYWFARRSGDLSLLWQERRFIKGAALQSQLSYRFLPLVLLWGSGIDIKGITPPRSRTWVGAGRNPVALMRTSWTDTNAIFLGVKGGSPSITHGHMDAGSFVMEANGVRWAMDAGYQDYNSLESKNIDLWEDRQGGQRWQVFRYINQVHNTLTVNGQEQRVKGHAKLQGYTADATFMEAKVALSSLYEGQLARADRGAAICKGRYVVVRDEIAAGDTAATVRWSMLTPASVQITGPHRAELTRQGKKLALIVEGTAPVEMRTWVSDPPPHDYDSPNAGTVIVGFITHLPAGGKGAFNVFLVPGDTKVEPVKSLQEWK
ncbi:heparinase II/III family protein [Flavitalea sp. BT771]|uniref:heparinase II/III domain-containing protein n=1 Tax=Flavitalea sp. BT771 TaxID=3063329 RepID=UPI0026E2242F|nr:heparinase II/III family protein [Flavitalea sp. BT771]MDO6430811.1 heparinase II/III family protein [Flavitalea sp. BT771]MDV6219049.1 heparinase II/III family protein [Flavitalea sp. BT771]